jgi:uncharacterized protein with ParB-like and HNH nuclease domain
MEAKQTQIQLFLQTPKVQFVIPVYQRNYDWTIAQCGELFRDIIAVEKEKRGSHFIPELEEYFCAVNLVNIRKFFFFTIYFAFRLRLVLKIIISCLYSAFLFLFQ